MKNSFFKIIAKLNKILLPSFSKKQLDFWLRLKRLQVWILSRSQINEKQAKILACFFYFQNEISKNDLAKTFIKTHS